MALWAGDRTHRSAIVAPNCPSLIVSATAAFTILESMEHAVFTPIDREILEQGLSALLRERSIAYEIAAKVAGERGLDRPNVHDFGLPDILRLSRTIRPPAPDK